MSPATPRAGPPALIRAVAVGRFPPAQVKAIIDRVLNEELGKKPNDEMEKQYDVEEAKEWSINICENIKSKVKGKCSPTVKEWSADAQLMCDCVQRRSTFRATRSLCR